MELAILRSCVGMPKMAFALRTCPPSSIPEATRTFDAAIEDYLSDHILGKKTINVNTMDQIGLPVKLGGLGIPSANKVGPAAFTGSVAQSLKLQRLLTNTVVTLPRPEFDLELNSLSDTYKMEMKLSLTSLESQSKPQQFISNLINESVLESLLERSDPRNAARLRALSMDCAGDWLFALPLAGPNNSLIFESSVFKNALCYRLGIALYKFNNGKCPACKDGILDPLGDHASICSGKYGKIWRHNKIAKRIYSELVNSGFSAREEVRGLLDEDGKKPADILVQEWNSSYYATCFDISVASPVISSQVMKCSKNAGLAIADGEKAKYRKYLKICEEATPKLGFYPLIFNSFGGASEKVMSLLKRIAHLIHERDNIELSIALNRIRQRLSVVFQKSFVDILQYRMC
jgi:hypothetical protein